MGRTEKLDHPKDFYVSFELANQEKGRLKYVTQKEMKWELVLITSAESWKLLKKELNLSNPEQLPH